MLCSCSKIYLGITFLLFQINDKYIQLKLKKIFLDDVRRKKYLNFVLVLYFDKSGFIFFFIFHSTTLSAWLLKLSLKYALTRKLLTNLLA